MSHMERQQPRVVSRRNRHRLRSLADLDARTSAAKAAFQLRDAITADLGGSDAITTAQAALIENAALMGAALADMAARYLAGEGADLALYCTIANAQRRLLTDLGLERRARDVTPDLREYLKGAA
jgi:hypothetical protein